MKFIKLLSFLLVASCSHLFGQMFNYTLLGNPVNTNGWVLGGGGASSTGQAYVSGNTIILNEAINSSSGYVYYSTPQNLAVCANFTVSFEFRMDQHGNQSADGLAFWYVTDPPNGYTAGMNIGLPTAPSPNGLVLIFDSYNNSPINNGLGPTPLISLRRFQNTNYNQGSSSGQLCPDKISQFQLTDGLWHTCTLTYNAGNINVVVDGGTPMVGNTTLNFSGYFGFSSSTGSEYSRHSIRNVVISGTDPDISVTAVPPNICGVGGSVNLTASGASTYTWSPASSLSASVGQAVTASPAITTQYTVTGTLPSGCSDTASITVTVNPNSSTTTALILCSGQLPAIWNGITIPTGAASNPAYTTYTTANAAGCDSVVTLNLTIKPNSSNTAALSLCSGELPASWNGITIPVGVVSNPAYTTYTTTNVAGCDSVVTLDLTIRPNSSNTAALSLCSGELPGSWNGIAIPVGAISNPAYTTYTTTNVAGCDSVVTLNLTIKPNTSGTAALTLCAGQLPASWNGVAIPVVAVSNPAYATYTTTNAAGCDSVVTLNLTINPNSTNTTALTLCSDQLPAIWNGVTIPVGAVSNPAYTTYATTNAAGCDSVVTLNLTIKPNAVSTATLTLCSGQLPTSWNSIAIPAGTASNPSYTTFIAPGTNGCDSITTLNLIIKPDVSNTVNANICQGESYQFGNELLNTSGNYNKTFPRSVGCDSVVMLNLMVHKHPSVNIMVEEQHDFCVSDTVVLRGEGAESYLWWFNNMPQNRMDGETIKIILSDNSSIAWLEGKDQFGCVDSASVELNAMHCCQLSVPNAFSPNNDGLNDQFGPVTNGHPRSYILRIYNRWGQLVFISHNVDNKWDGQYQGKQADVGTYFYSIINNCTNGELRQMKGDITLLR